MTKREALNLYCLGFSEFVSDLSDFDLDSVDAFSDWFLTLPENAVRYENWTASDFEKEFYNWNS